MVEGHKNPNILCFLAENEVIKVTAQTVQKLELKHLSVDTKPTCQHCGSTNVYGMSSVVGYFRKINNWNDSKKAELRDRQKGDYKI